MAWHHHGYGSPHILHRLNKFFLPGKFLADQLWLTPTLQRYQLVKRIIYDDLPPLLINNRYWIPMVIDHMNMVVNVCQYHTSSCISWINDWLLINYMSNILTANKLMHQTQTYQAQIHQPEVTNYQQVDTPSHPPLPTPVFPRRSWDAWLQ